MPQLHTISRYPTPSPHRRAKQHPSKPAAGQEEEPQSQSPKRDRLTLIVGLFSILANVATCLLVLPPYLAARTENTQLQLTEPGYIQNAIVELGSHNPDLQLSGIYALKEITKNFPADQPGIIDDLCRYIRTHDQARRIANPRIYTGAGRSPSNQVRAALQVIVAAGSAAGPIDLHGTDLSGADLQGARFADADLSGSLLSSANLSNADLDGADLNRANLNSANLDGARLSNALLPNAYLISSTLNNVNLTKATLTSSLMFHVQLNSANLTNARLVDVNAFGGHFRKAHLDGVDLADCTLSGADFTHATLKKADLTECALYSVDFEHADLTGAKLVHVHYWHARTTGARGFKVISGSLSPPPQP